MNKLTSNPQRGEGRTERRGRHRRRQPLGTPTATAPATIATPPTPPVEVATTTDIGDGKTRTYTRIGWLHNGSNSFALLDTGAEVEALISDAEATRIGAVARKDSNTTLSLCGGRSSMTTCGTVTLQPLIYGIDAYGEDCHTLLPELEAKVVDAVLAPYGVLIGARFLEKVSARIDVEQRWWRIGTHAAYTRGPLLPEASAGDDEKDSDNAPEHTTDDMLAATREHLRMLTGDAVAQMRTRIGSFRKRPTRAMTLPAEMAALDSVGLADRLEEAHTKAAQAQLEQVAAAELENKSKIAEEWAKAISEFAPRVALTAGTIGEATWRLNETQRSELAGIFQSAARQLCSAQLLPRSPQAHLPVAVTFDVNPEAKPTAEGVKRGLSADKQEAAMEKVDVLHAAGLIEAAKHPDWVHAVVLAKKKDGTYRFAIDYRPLNAALRPQLYPLPDTEALLRKLATKRIFSTYDMSDAFWHLGLQPRDRPFTAFHVPGRGTYQWTVLPMGIQPATAAWQANMERVFAPLLGRGVDIFVDDMVLSADTPEELLRLTREVHALISKYDLRIGAKKARMFVEEIEFLGRTVSFGRIAVAERHITAIKEFAKPTTVHDLQRFLGLVNYQRAHLRRLGDHMAPLVEMQKTAMAAHGMASNGVKKKEVNVKLQWTPESDAAFVELRQQLATPPALCVPDMRSLAGRVRLETDACTETAGRPGGVGGAAFWQDDAGTWRMVMAYSRTLKPAERKYAPVEVEMLGAIELLRAAAWLVSKAGSVELITDHQALQFVAKIGSVEHGRLARWAARLLDGDIRITYRRGADNVVADALSRAPRIEASSPTGDVVAAVDDIDIRTQMRAMPSASFDAVFIDYPWKHDTDRHERWFKRLPDEVWMELDLLRVMAADAVVFIAVPDCLLLKALDVTRKLGLSYHRSIQWWKNRAVPSRIWPNCKWEHILIASRGQPTKVLRQRHGVEGAVIADVREPCRKPDELYKAMEEMLRPDARRLDLFARERRPGWTPLGDEIDKFAEVAAVTTRTGGDPPLAPSPAASPTYIIPNEPTNDTPGTPEPSAATTPTPTPPPPERTAPAVAEWSETATDLLLFAQDKKLYTRIRTAAAMEGCGKDNDEAARSWLQTRKAHIAWMQVPPQVIERFVKLTKEIPPVAVIASGHPDHWLTEEELERHSDAQLVLPILRAPTAEGQVAYVPDSAKEMRKWLIGEAHAKATRHSGVTKTIGELKRAGWWLHGKCTTEVKRFVAECEVCQRLKPDHPRRTHFEAGEHDVPAAFGYHVHIDTMGPREGKFVISMTDALTKWPEAVVVESKEAAEVAVALHREWICRYGAPRLLTSDRGSEFCNQVLNELRAAHAIKHMRTTPYHPQSNGIEERAHRTIKSLLRTIMAEQKVDEWVQALPEALRVLRATVHRSTGHSPARLVLGRELTMGPKLFESDPIVKATAAGKLAMEPMPPVEVLDAETQRRADEMQRMHEDLWARLTGKLEAGRQQTAAKDPYANFKVGTYVRFFRGELAEINSAGNEDLWSEVHRVVDRVAGVSLVLCQAGDPLRSNTQSAMRCKIVALTDDKRAEFDKLYEETMAQINDNRRHRADKHDWAEDRWVIEEILGERGTGDGRQLEIRWQGHPVSTWEPFSRMAQDVPAMVKRYEAARKRAERANRSRGRRNSEEKRGAERAPRRK